MFVCFLQDEVKNISSDLPVHAHNIKVTEVLQDGDTLTFIIISQKVWPYCRDAFLDLGIQLSEF